MNSNRAAALASITAALGENEPETKETLPRTPHSDRQTAKGVNVRALAHAEAVNAVIDDDCINAPPMIPADAFPPDLQSAVSAACSGTEAHPMAVALHLVTMFASHIGQQRYIRIGDDKQALDFCSILVGRTGKVKGTAEKPADLINRLACQDLVTRHGYTPPRCISGLSSGEGLIQAIKDPADADDETGTYDKRLLVIESEYANILSQDQRGGNTLSVVLRDAFDGKTLSNQTVNPRTATSPHISIIGHITPGELVSHKSFEAQSVNGALNRNLIFFAARPRAVPRPRAFTEQERDALSKWFADTIFRSRNGNPTDSYLERNTGKEMVMSEAAGAILDAEYIVREAEQDRMPERLANPCSRHRVFVWRLSALLALMDYSDVIQADHVRQAYKWIDYSRDSIRYLLNTARQEAEQAALTTFADEVCEAIGRINNGQGCTKTAIHDHFNRNKTAAQLDDALKLLLSESPARVEVVTAQRKGRGRPSKTFQVTKKTN
ncbi:MAG: hypothetical protein B0D91_09135 [Oceanospirillales bacterium LUC14_002_19_P2]|nr:MAG: hypothetical protein B0D91_09135 [Oceanospirillales bacterium LUC14_002_19_P2]